MLNEELELDSMKRCVIIFVWASVLSVLHPLAFGVVYAQDVGLTAKTDSSSYRMADIITVHVLGRLTSAVDSIAPDVRDSIQQFEIVGLRREGSEPRWTVQLMTLDSGNIAVPPIPFTYRLHGDPTPHSASTNPVAINVRGVTVDAQGEIKDIKPPVDAPFRFEDAVPYLVGVILLAAAAAGYYYYRKNQKRKGPAPLPAIIISPHKEALLALRLVEEKKLWQQGKVKQYYSEVTDIVRKFFERRWNIIALELTSDEILMQMKPIPEALKVWKPMQSLFTTADLVKFAKYQPSPEDHENEMQWAYEIVRGMIPPAKTVEEEKEQEAVDAR